MNNHIDERKQLIKIIDVLDVLLKKANGWDSKTQQYQYGCLLPGISWQSIQFIRSQIDPIASSTPDYYLALVKHDISKINTDHGTIEFTALTHLMSMDANYDAYDVESRKYAPVKLFTYPRNGDLQKYEDYGFNIFFDVAGFSIDYDFRAKQEYLLIRLNNVSLSLEPFSLDPQAPASSGKPILNSIFKSPAVEFSVEIKVPKSLDFRVDFPSISLNLSDFTIDIDLNFPSLSNMSWSPLSFGFPEWLKWPFGPISFGSLFGSNFNPDCKIAFAGPGWFKCRVAGIDFGILKDIFGKLGNLLGFFSLGKSNVPYFKQSVPGSDSPIPEYLAIYVDLTGVAKHILGGYKPKQLHVLLGVHTKSRHLKVGLLSWTEPLEVFNNNSLMFQSAMQLQFETQEDKSLVVHPGFSVEVLSGKAHAALAAWAKSTTPPIPARYNASSFSAQADRIAIEWDADERDYVFFVDGAIIINKLLKDKDAPGGVNKPPSGTGLADNLTLPIKGIGISTSGRLVLKNTWNLLDNALQVKLDNFGEVVLFLRAFGYGKKNDGAYWFGFSGDIALPVLGVKAGVDRLVFTSDGNVELAGVRIEMDIADVLAVSGAAAWGEGLNAPKLPGINLDGFGGELGLYIKPFSFGTNLEMTYVNCTLPPDRFVAWSFYLDVPLPVTIPVCFCLGINSMGLMLGQNYIPLPKQKKVPVQKWLAEGFDGDVNNILKVLKYWTVDEGKFAAGLAVGIATTSDNGYILNARAIAVLVVPGPIVMIAGKANILSVANPGKSGAFDLLIVYDQDDPGVLIGLAFRYDLKSLITVDGMAEIYFSFTRADDWHIYLGTPARPVAGRLLLIFDANAYLTVDPDKITAGAMVQYGCKWNEGPVVLKYYISFSGDLVISWNPAFVNVKVAIQGEAAIRIFGFGLGAGLRAAMQIKAPKPWYLSAEVEARFSIGLLFFSWSWTAHFDLAWGSDITHPSVFLDNVHEKTSYLSLNGSATSNDSSLLPDKSATTSKICIPMDGVLGLKFARDMEIDTTGADFPSLASHTKVAVRDEVSKDAAGIKRFRGKLKGFRIQSKSANTWASVNHEIYFAWTPHDDNDRRKLVVRDIDLGYSQFQLNDDPNARVKLTCPKLFESDTPLRFNVDLNAWQEVNGSFAVDSPLHVPAQSPAEISITLKGSTKSGPAYKYQYPGFGVTLTAAPTIQLERQHGLSIHAQKGLELTFANPMAQVSFAFIPAGAPAVTPVTGDYFTLYDETDADITQACDCRLVPGPMGFVAFLNVFDAGQVFCAQLPPTRGVMKLVFRRAGIIVQQAVSVQGTYHVSAYPLLVLQDIHKRNLQRLAQRAKLGYVLGQNGDPGKLLWDPVAHRMSGEALWATDQGERNPMTPDAPGISCEFGVIKPFAPVDVEVNGETHRVQAYGDYLRALSPVEGQRPFYRELSPAITFRCNYVNAMLKKADCRLAMVLEDANGKSCEYSRLMMEFIKVPTILKPALTALARHMNFTGFNSVKHLQETASTLSDGLNGEMLATGFGEDTWRRLTTEIKEGQTVFAGVQPSDSLLHHTRGLLNEGDALLDSEFRHNVEELEKLLLRTCQSPSDKVLSVRSAENSPELLVLRVVTGLVEYRYVNDDLALDVSALQLADCLAPNQSAKLNAYERGYFTPVLPAGAFWAGLQANTSYTAKTYCLDATADLAEKRSELETLHSVSFTTSRFASPNDLIALLGKIRMRDVFTDQSVYEETLKQLKPDFSPPAFTRKPPSKIQIATGMELFRELNEAAAVKISDRTTHQVEEAYQTLYETAQKRVQAQLKIENLTMQSILDGMGLHLTASPARRIIGTWFRTQPKGGANGGTIGLLLEFPEPIDWERTGIRIEKFSVQIDGEAGVTDMLTPTAGNPSFDATCYWLRSLDGTRLFMLPRLVKTCIDLPKILKPKHIPIEAQKLSAEYTRAADLDTISVIDSDVSGEMTAGDSTGDVNVPGRDRACNEQRYSAFSVCARKQPYIRLCQTRNFTGQR